MSGFGNSLGIRRIDSPLSPCMIHRPTLSYRNKVKGTSQDDAKTAYIA